MFFCLKIVLYRFKRGKRFLQLQFYQLMTPGVGAGLLSCVYLLLFFELLEADIQKIVGANNLSDGYSVIRKEK